MRSGLLGGCGRWWIEKVRVCEGKMLEVSGVGEAKNEFELESEPC